MARVVVFSWNVAAQMLVYVPVEGGNGGEARSLAVGQQSAADVADQCAAVTLPRVGDLLVDGDECLLELSGPAVTRCSARWRKPSIRLRDRLGGAPMADLAPEAMGLAESDVAAQVENIGSFLLFDAPDADGVIGCWECEGGLAGWLTRLRERRAQRAAVREAARTSADADRRFINPYTFVPFPEAIGRARPAGHHALGAGRLSGVFEVSFEFTSPMQAPEGAVTGQQLRLPGASVKGAVRSLHETVAGGCLRVLDEDFVPSYRDAAAPGSSSDGWTLAVVDEATRDGQPLTVRLCDPVVWVRAQQLRAAWGRQLATGSRVTLTPPTGMSSLGRLELAADAPVERGGEWVVLLTDAGARPDTKLKKPGAYFAACGRLGDEYSTWEVAESAWTEFRRAVAGAREVVERRAGQRTGQGLPEWVTVKFRDEEIGRRKAVTGRFATGDVVWARPSADGGTVVGLSLARIWRHAGVGPLGGRVPAHLRACPHPTARQPDPAPQGGVEGDEGQLLLCPSCRLFGAADIASRDSDSQARQRAYAGHVRFGDAVSPGQVQLTVFRRAPLGAPRPGAGQLYLRYDNPAPAHAQTDRPTREWGANPDLESPASGSPAGGAPGEGLTEPGSSRLVRGRKFYWHADPQRQGVPRHIARPHQANPRMLVERQLAPAGTVLVGTVTFDNLSEAELGGLLATLEPGRVLPPEEPGGRPLRLRLGGGKPLGLGSCRAVVSGMRVWSAGSRYGDADPVLPDVERYVAAFRTTVPVEVAATWPAVTAVLAEDTVDATRVWYPPGAHWSDQRDEAKAFDEPFAFFVGTSGMFLARGKARPLQPLPEPTASDVSLPIIRKQDLGKGSEGGR